MKNYGFYASAQKIELVLKDSLKKKIKIKLFLINTGF